MPLLLLKLIHCLCVRNGWIYRHVSIQSKGVQATGVMRDAVSINLVMDLRMLPTDFPEYSGSAAEKGEECFSEFHNVIPVWVADVA